MVIGWQLLYSIVRDFLPFLVLGAWWDFNCHVSVECLYCDFRTKHCLTYVQIQVCVDVRSFSPEVRMVSYLYMDYKITCRPSLASMPFLRHSQVNSIVDSLGDVDGFFCIPMSGASPSASHAWIPNYLADSVTTATHLLDHEGTLSNGLETLTTTASTS